MSIISKICFPASPELTNLYFKLEDGCTILSYEKSTIILGMNKKVSLNTYFNSIYENYIVKYTSIKDLRYELFLEGAFRVFLYRQQKFQNPVLIRVLDFLDCLPSSSSYISFHLEAEISQQGRIYLEILSLNHESKLYGGMLSASQEKQTEVSLSIVICTYKKENYVKSTVRKLLENKNLNTKYYEIIVVDNAKTLALEDFPKDNRIHLLPSRNVGGSGGFTRGILEALSFSNTTHILLMDDDVSIDENTIYSLISFYEFSISPACIAGAMLDLNRPCTLYEAGAKYATRLEYETILMPDIMQTAPIRHKLLLSDPTELNLLMDEAEFDYGGFWFFSFPKELIIEVGLPLPFFIKVDDMEYSLRIRKQSKMNLLQLPQISVWHEPFYLKRVIWDLYYYTRNMLICNAIHYNYSSWITLLQLTKRFIGKVFIFDYNAALMVLKGLEDYLKGEVVLNSKNTEDDHLSIIQQSKSFKHEVKLDDFIKCAGSGDVKLTDIIISLLTINGHFLPNFMLYKEDGYLMANIPHPWLKACRKKSIIEYHKHLGFFRREISREIGINLCFRWFLLILRAFFQWRNITKSWRQAKATLSSTRFWKEYLSS